MLYNSRIFISGATGTWGQALVSKLLNSYSPEQIVCFSRGELSQVAMQRKFNNDKLKFIIGDVRDYEAVDQALKNIDVVFHLAALKHVPICEDNVEEAIKTNIQGTLNIAKAAVKNRVKKVIEVSTDKAVLPNNLYGMTKSVAEKAVLSYNKDAKTKFSIVRAGNVLGSNGSVVPFFISQIKNGGPITITDSRMTRFFITVEEAIELLLKSASIDSEGILVMNMPSCKIMDLVNVLMSVYGQVDVKEVGIRKGEKLHEVLISEHEGLYTCRHSEDYWLITEKLQNNQDPFKQLDSNSMLMEDSKIYSLLAKAGFI